MNVLFSALLKDSATRRILLTIQNAVYFPAPSLQKIEKYHKALLERTGYTEREFISLLYRIFQNITLVQTSELSAHWTEAKQVMEHIDPEDVTIIAAALSQNATIWSDDKHFEKQTRIRMLKTKDTLEALDGR